MGMYEERVRAAMERLLLGQPAHTDGRLTISNLATESALERQTLYRSEPELLAEFNAHKDRLRREDTAAPGGSAARAERLQVKLQAADERATRYRQERDESREQLETLANQLVLAAARETRLQASLEAAGTVKALRPAD